MHTHTHPHTPTACGLYYAAELAEEYASATKKVIAWAVAIVMALHVALGFEKFPLPLLAGGLACHGMYALLLRDFPNVEIFSVKFGLSLCECVCLCGAGLGSCGLIDLWGGRQYVSRGGLGWMESGLGAIHSSIRCSGPAVLTVRTYMLTRPPNRPRPRPRQARSSRTTACGSSTSTPGRSPSATSSTPWCVPYHALDRNNDVCLVPCPELKVERARVCMHSIYTPCCA